MLVRAVPVLTVLLLIEMVGGTALAGSYQTVRAIFLVLIPPFLAVGGNVGSVFGSRVSSGLHLGLIRPSLRENPELRSNLVALSISGLVSFLCLGVFVYLIGSFIGVTDISPVKFMLITLLSGCCLTFLAIGISLGVCFASFRRGLDPDDVVVPVVASMTDLLGIVLLLGFILLLGS